MRSSDVTESPTSAPVTEFRTRRRVEFADTDTGGIVHFARFLVFMETAEHEFLQSLGFEAFSTRDGTTLGWPRVEVSCQYLSPAHYGDDARHPSADCPKRLEFPDLRHHDLDDRSAGGARADVVGLLHHGRR